MCGGVALLLGGVLACTDARSSSFLTVSARTCSRPGKPSCAPLVRRAAARSTARARGALASGVWTCAPLDIYKGGYVDTIGVAQGMWWVDEM